MARIITTTEIQKITGQMINFDFVSLGYASLIQTTKRARKMATIAGLKLLLQYFTGVYYGYVLFINIDNIKGWLLTGVAVCAAIVKIYFIIQNGRRNLKERDFRLKDMAREDKRKERLEQQP